MEGKAVMVTAYVALLCISVNKIRNDIEQGGTLGYVQFERHGVPKLYNRRHRLQTYGGPTCPRHSIRDSASRFVGARFVSGSTSSRTRFLDLFMIRV